ncbi:MAG: hypothetical protein A2X99_10205 [Deltaproteobacteria bacterium GWB2_55_19]|nr:MAG: hypothetical protein A2X99_10205 [Deltaproteobacteria bacterium GWB2_55_19]HAO93422.1 hypothetical protein [Deltaproteobacteria bacterium]
MLGYEAALASVEERYWSLSASASEFMSAVSESGAALELFKAEEGSIFGFLEIGERFKEEEEYFKARIDLEKESFTALDGYRKLHEAGVKSMQSVETKAYQALGDELLKLVEIHKFSIGEFAKAMAEQVKIELTGLAAKAAIWAIYETAMGLKDLAVGSPGTAGMHFAAAEEFGVIAGASLAAAAGVQALVPGDSDESSSSSSSSGTSSAQSSSSVQAYDSGSTGATQQVTVNIYNPLSEQNWQKIVEESIVPALNNAAEKNITISVNK